VQAAGRHDDEAVRGTDQPRLLTFRASESTVEFELASDGLALRLVGRISPAAPGELEIRGAAHAVVVAPDALGRFVAGGLAHGPLQLRWRPAAGPQVVTEWLSA
jgi:hypothetical protein